MAESWDDYSPDRLFMLGIIHRDKSNDAIILTWVERIKPDVITIEISPYGLAFRQILGPVYREKIDTICRQLQSEQGDDVCEDLKDLYAFIEVPPEYTVCHDYCVRNRASLFPVDMDHFSFIRLRNIDELIDIENIRKISAHRPRNNVSSEHVIAGLFFKSGITAFTYDAQMEIRDRYMSRKIALLKRHFGDRRFLHIAGWKHLKDPLNIYDPFRPVKIFAYD